MRRIAAALLLFAGLLVAAPLAAQSSPFGVAAGDPSNGWSPVLHLNGVLDDPAFREALHSGLPLRFRFRIELWEKAFFDRLVGTQEFALALVRDPLEGHYELTQSRTRMRFSRLQDAERILMASATPQLRPQRRGRYYYIASLDVETLSLSDLEELQRWIRGEAGPAVQGRTPVGRAVGRGLQRAFVRMIGLPARRYEARSPTFAAE